MLKGGKPCQPSVRTRMSFPALVTSSAKTEATIFFVNSTARQTRWVFIRPYFGTGVKLKMATIRHKFEIAQLVIKSIAVNVVNHFVFFQFSTKILFHHIAVLIYPFSRANFDSDVLEGAASPNSFGKKGQCSGVIHSSHCNADALPSCFWISGNMKAFFTLVGVMVGIAIRSFNRSHRLATNAAWLGKGWSHV